MKPNLIALLLGLFTCTATAQDHGLVGGVVHFQVRVNYYRPGLRTVDSDIPKPALVHMPKVDQIIPAPYRVRLFEFAEISEDEAIALGVSPSLIQTLRNQQTMYLEQYGPPYGDISFSKGYTGTYVGRMRKTVGTLGARTSPLNGDPVGGIRYARFVRDRMASHGWTNSWHLEDGSISNEVFAGPGALVSSSGVDLAFYAGHANENGPLYPGADPNQYFWGELANQSRGLRWMVTQSCNWFTYQPDGPYSLNAPWAKPMKGGNGSMHAIFGYSSVAWLWPSFIWDAEIPFGSVSDTDCAPVAFIENAINWGAANGPSWFLGSHNQRSSMRTISRNYGLGLDSTDYGEVPTVLSVKNWYGDYFYESIQAPWPDPVDLEDPNPTLMIHSTIVGSPKWH